MKLQPTDRLLSPYVAKRLIAGLAILPSFPNEPEARRPLVQLLSSMALYESEARWLVERMADLYAAWPGADEMRACFCSKFQPRDGLERRSSVYPNGIPVENLPVPAPVEEAARRQPAARSLMPRSHRKRAKTPN
jgi:hypothetical protein